MTEFFKHFLRYFEFVKPIHTDVHIFTFDGFLGILAIFMVLLTMTSVRYRFRVATAPFPFSLKKLTFSICIFTGMVMLLLEYIYANQFRVPMFISNAATTQFLLGLLFFAPIVLWIYFAFINPPVFSKANAKSFYKNLEYCIFQGSEDELPAITNELSFSANSIIKLSREIPNEKLKVKKYRCQDHAYRLLLLIGQKKFCQHIIKSSPATAVAFFHAMTAQEKYKLPITQFAANVFHEALINTDSILYHEDSLYDSGLMGLQKPFTHYLFSDYKLIEQLSNNGKSPFDLSYELTNEWSRKELKVYLRCFLVFCESYLTKLSQTQSLWGSISFIRGIETISPGPVFFTEAANHLTSNSRELGLIQETVWFTKELLRVISETNLPAPFIRCRSNNNLISHDIYDHIAQLIFEIMLSVSYIKEPSNLCWSAQYSIVASSFFCSITSKQNKIVSQRLRRLIYDEINQLKKFPNWQSIRILGYCLNVMGLTTHEFNVAKDFQRFHKLILKWTKTNFMNIYDYNPEIANACLMGEMQFDPKEKLLIKYYAQNLDGKKPKRELSLT